MISITFRIVLWLVVSLLLIVAPSIFYAAKGQADWYIVSLGVATVLLISAFWGEIVIPVVVMFIVAIQAFFKTNNVVSSIGIFLGLTLIVLTGVNIRKSIYDASNPLDSPKD